MIKYKKNIGYANRGMFLEHIINNANTYYLSKDIAIIYKKPTPIKVLNVAYRSSKTTLIDKAVFSETSTLDYNGVYKGRYIEFDAKETNNKTSFPIANIHMHQLKHIENIIRNKGICFLIVRFNLINKTYLLIGRDLLDFIKKEERKSIPLSFFEDNCEKLELKYSPRLDYIKIIDKYMEEIWKIL